MMMGLIQRSTEILINEGFRQFVEAVERYFWWHPILYEPKWRISRLLRSRYQIVEVIHGNKMLIDISSDGIQKYLYLYGIHEPESTMVFSEIIPKDARVVDIGANIGYFALIEARRAQKVYAIEPEPNNIALLRKNIALNSYEDVIEVHQFAVSDKTGKAKLVISDIPNHHRLRVPSDTQSEKVIEVETITIDEFLKDKVVDVVRMDLEGAEWLVINGMKNLISKRKPLILFIEVHPKQITEYGGDTQAMLDYLFESGFKIGHLDIGLFEHPNYSLRNSIKAVGRRKQALNFNPPADKHKLNITLDQLFGKIPYYRIFLTRS